MVLGPEPAREEDIGERDLGRDSPLSLRHMAQRTASQIAVRHQWGMHSMQMTGDTGVTADVASMLGNGGKRRGSTPKRPQEPYEHESTAGQENGPENPPAGRFARHMIKVTCW